MGSGCAGNEMKERQFVPRYAFQYSEGVNINFEKVGDQGPAIVFLHGFGASLNTWSDIRNSLPQGFRYYFVDLKGFGFSSKPNDKKYSLSDQADIIAKFIREHDFEQVVLVGHSYGGGVALFTYMKFVGSESNPIKKMILIDSAGYTFRFPFFIDFLRTPIINAFVLNVVPKKYRAKHTLNKLFYDKAKVTKERIHRYSFFFDMPGSHKSFVRAAKQVLPEDHEEVVKRIKEIDVLTLILWGRNDPIIPVDDAYKFQADISLSEVTVIEECGHVPHEEKPEEISGVVSNFLCRP